MELNTVNINKSVVNKLKEWRESPLLFVTECLKATPTTQQMQLLTGEHSIAKHKRNTVRSGHGPGKSAVAAWIILWFMVTRPLQSPCTAPLTAQLKDVLVSEISKWLRQSLVVDEFIMHRDILFQRMRRKNGGLGLFLLPLGLLKRNRQKHSLVFMLIIC